MTHYWNELEGVSLAGRYWLKQCISSTPDDAWYLIRFGIGQDAAVRAVPAELPFAPEQLAVWRDLIAVDQPHIARMLDAGRTEAEGSDLIYAVCEYPDDFLSAVLRDRPLSSAEAREVLLAALSALSYLHDNDLAHGALDPSHIMAFGDRIKLPSDTIRRAGHPAPAVEPGAYDAPEVAAGGPVTAASDMWSLGITLHEILTQQPPNLQRDAEFLYMAEPFATILRHTLIPDPHRRWTVRDIEAHLNPPVKVPEPVAPVVADPPALLNGTPDAELTRRTAPPAPARQSLPPAATRLHEFGPRSNGFTGDADNSHTPQSPAALPPPAPRGTRPLDRGFPMKWVPVAGLVAAGLLSTVLFRNSDRPRAATTNQAERAAPSPAPVPPPVATPVRQAVETAKPSPIPDKQRATVARPDQPAIWRVVAYTYAARAAAEKKAHGINEKNPDLRAAVFAPKGDRAPYYVSLAGRMTYQEAERLQKKALAKGMPRDTFVRNFTN